MAAFDVGASIADFLADAESTSLELPHMTTGQRKSAKKLLEKYPELRCESYGFGAERQLYIFKKSADKAAGDHVLEAAKSPDFTPSAVSIKNTFIDDWATTEPEPLMFRSLQPQSDYRPSRMENNKRMVDFASYCKAPRSGNLEIVVPNDASETTPNKATVSSDQDGALPVAHEEIQVRNTFIHFEKAPADERAVQSMPHGMFKQCILNEASQISFGYDTPTTTGCNTPTSASEAEAEMTGFLLGESQAAQPLSIGVGTLVVVEGLQRAPHFNGRSAVVQGWDEATGRYNILLVDSESCQHAKIKEENLRVVAACP